MRAALPLALGALVACAHHHAAHTGASTEASQTSATMSGELHHPDSPGEVGFGTLRFGMTPAQAAQASGATAQGDGLTGRATIGGVDASVSLTFGAGRLFRLDFVADSVRGCGAAHGLITAASVAYGFPISDETQTHFTWRAPGMGADLDCKDGAPVALSIFPDLEEQLMQTDWFQPVDTIVAAFGAPGPQFTSSLGGHELSVTISTDEASVSSLDARSAPFADMGACGQVYQAVRADLVIHLGDAADDNLSTGWDLSGTGITLACNPNDDGTATLYLSAAPLRP